MTGMVLWAVVIVALWVWAVWGERRDRPEARRAREDRRFARRHRCSR